MSPIARGRCDVCKRPFTQWEYRDYYEIGDAASPTIVCGSCYHEMYEQSRLAVSLRCGNPPAMPLKKHESSCTSGLKEMPDYLKWLDGND